ncbi:MAG: DUF4760 domain-containing protein [Alphaproteobacteria bacterium]
MFTLEVPHAILIGAALATAGWLYTARRGRTLARKQHTINIMLKGNFDERLRSAHKQIADHIRAHTTFPEPKAPEFQALLPDLRLILNHYEFIAAGIRRGDVDERLVIDAERGTILSLFEKSETYIFSTRTNRRNQALYEHLEWLHVRWEKSPPVRVVCACEWFKGSPFYGRRNAVR